MDKTTTPAEPYRPVRAVLQGLLDLRPSLGLERAAVSVEDAVARGLAVAKVYAFASVDYPGAAQSSVLDSDGTTAVGAFDFDPGSDTGMTAFTFADGVYQILTVPSSTLSVATGINGAGLIVGLYFDLAGVLRGFANNAGTFSNVDFPGASATQVIGVNDAGQMVGDYFDGTGEHGFVSDGGTFTAIDFPGPPGPRPPESMPPATSSEHGRTQRESTAFCSRPACSPQSTFRSRPGRPRSASTTAGISPALTATPPTTATVSSTPAVPSAP